MDPERVLASSESTALALRLYGKACFSSGLPRYMFVYALTAVQNEWPQYRHELAGAWQVDRRWQLEEPGSCRAVLSAPVLRAALCLASLWNWPSWVGITVIGFLAMLHPAEFVPLLRSDLMFPQDSLGAVQSLYIHLRQPKTARLARRQHSKIDDPWAIRLCYALFGALEPSCRLFPASMAVYRRQWNAVMDRLGIPRKQTERGATPGVLRGSGATALYLATENIPLIAWRGRWARTRALEFYLQEVGAQLFLHELSPVCRSRIEFLSQRAQAVLACLWVS